MLRREEQLRFSDDAQLTYALWAAAALTPAPVPARLRRRNDDDDDDDGGGGGCSDEINVNVRVGGDGTTGGGIGDVDVDVAEINRLFAAFGVVGDSSAHKIEESIQRRVLTEFGFGDADHNVGDDDDDDDVVGVLSGVMLDARLREHRCINGMFPFDSEVRNAAVYMREDATKQGALRVGDDAVDVDVVTRGGEVIKFSAAARRFSSLSSSSSSSLLSTLPSSSSPTPSSSSSFHASRPLVLIAGSAS
jgi:hypothetical protein